MNNPIIKKIAAVVVGIAVFVGIVFGYFSIFGTRASDSEPRDVVILKIEKNSASVTWATGVDTQGIVEYGTTPTALNFFAPEVAKTKAHSIDLTLLSPNTTYYFDIKVGDTKFDNGGVPWTFTTKGAEASVSSPTATSTPAKGADQSKDSTIKPTPVQSLRISDGTSCTETDCEKIKTLLGKGCSTQDYFKCLKKPTTAP